MSILFHSRWYNLKNKNNSAVIKEVQSIKRIINYPHHCATNCNTVVDLLYERDVQPLPALQNKWKWVNFKSVKNLNFLFRKKLFSFVRHWERSQLPYWTKRNITTVNWTTITVKWISRQACSTRCISPSLLDCLKVLIDLFYMLSYHNKHYKLAHYI